MLSPEVLEAQQAIELPAREMLKKKAGTAKGGDASNNLAAGNNQGDVNNTGGENIQLSLAALLVEG
jgi:hypothetical protein